MLLTTLETRRLSGDKIEVFKIGTIMRMLIGICSSNLKKAVEPEDTRHEKVLFLTEGDK